MVRRDRTPTRDKTDRMKKDEERSRYMKVKQEIKFKNGMESLQWEAYQLGINNLQRYDKENLWRLIKTVTADQLIEFENWSKEYQAS